ncbi:hypothetical protein ACIQF6_03310 [Kitasatospora sp. NPDC092948]|uniref:hypothetical protein n=1 Tax=Kitasatospora sp. NPDC092948 TaxID=3364088 RepID=UPI00381E9D5E
MRHSRKLTLAAVLLATASTATAGNTAAYGLQPAPGPRAAAIDPHLGPEVDVGAGETGIATVECPSGEVPTGGGGFNPALLSGHPFAITNSFPEGNVWVLTALNTSSSVQKLAAFVLCSSVAHTVVESAPGNLNPGTGGSATVTCPDGLVTSGGGVHSSGTEVEVSALHATPNTWSVRVANNSGAVQAASAVVICADIGTSGRTGESKVIAPHSTGVVLATCPQGQVPTGGGIFTDNPGAFISGLNSSGPSWFSGVNNLTDSPVTAAAQVICTAG